MDLTINVFSKILGIYALLIIVLGTIGNFFCVFVCLRKNLRFVPTFVFMAFMGFVDVFSLYWSNLGQFFRVYFNNSLTSMSVFHCKMNVFFQASSLQASAWLLVAMSIERCLSVWIKSWRTTKFNSKKAVILSIFILIVIFLSNIDFPFNMNYINKNQVTLNSSNGNISTEPVYTCSPTLYIMNRSQSHTYMYSVIPFTLISIANGFLIYAIIHGKSDALTRSRQDQLKRKGISLSVVYVTFAFIVLTMPSSVIQGSLTWIGATELGLFIAFLAAELAYSYHCFNFILIILVNKQFKKELITLLKSLKNNKVSVQSSRPQNPS